MKFRRHIRSSVLVCIAAALLALQLNAGTVQRQGGRLAIVAAHHSATRHISSRRLNAKRLLAAVPVAAGRDPLAQVCGIVVSLRTPSAPLCHTGMGPARAPPLS
jgi:anaerobic selenocysteine-containing dehydrogenase